MWSCSQGPYALSSAGAELYAIVESVTWEKGIRTLAGELRLSDLSGVMRLGVDSNAAKSFVNRRGLSRMKHWEIKDLWLQIKIMGVSFAWIGYLAQGMRWILWRKQWGPRIYVSN